MKRLILICLPALLLASNGLMAQTEAEMKAWMAYMTPSDIHKMIAKSDGEWTTAMTMWMDAKAKPVTSTGTCTNKMVMGGRYQESFYAGDFMGSPMEGKGTLAYDNAKKAFQSSWIDNMGTGIMFLTGAWDDATKTINFSGVMTDPATGKDMKVRQTLKIVDDTHHVMEMYMSGEGISEFKSMELKFTKK